MATASQVAANGKLAIMANTLENEPEDRPVNHPTNQHENQHENQPENELEVRSENASGNELEIESNPIEQDLVICVDHNFSFDNRWAFTNDLVDYRTVVVWDDQRLEMDCSKLKRVKIYGLRAEPMAALLERLCSAARLEQLEIDTLEIKKGTANTYLFNHLKRISVNAIKFVDNYTEVANPTDKIRFNFTGSCSAEYLYFGSNSLDHIDCIHLNPSDLIRSIGSARAFDVIDNLRSVSLTEVFAEELQLVPNDRPFYESPITRLIMGEIAGLQKIHLNLDKITTTYYRPTPDQFELLNAFYNYLQQPDHPTQTVAVKADLEIFIHGVKIDLKRFEFADYKFDLPLVDVYEHNHVYNDLQLEPCQSVSAVRYLELPDILEYATVDNEPDGVEYCERRFAGLMHHFPNLRVVIVQNREGVRLGPRSFLAFLSLCRSITELCLDCAGFSVGFYDRLVDLESLRTLHKFALVEPFGHASVLTDFGFLDPDRLPQLRWLRTNLATRTVMLDCVFKKMQMSADFEFQFYDLRDTSLCYFLRYRKLDGDRWELRVQLESFREENEFSRELYNGVLTYDALLLLLSQSKNWYFTSHWLSDHFDLAAIGGQLSRCNLI